MRIYVSGIKGYIGRNLAPMLLKRGHQLVSSLEQEPDAFIHLAWSGLPNYINRNHLDNVALSFLQLQDAVDNGVKNITIAGTCLETVGNPPPYAIAKLAVRALAFEMLPTVKWARLWYVYGKDQPEHCLVPRLMKAARDGEETFSVISGESDFISISDVALSLCFIVEQQKVTGIIDVCSGGAKSVTAFCERMTGDRPKIVADRPMADYEPRSFHGDNTKLSRIFEHA